MKTSALFPLVLVITLLLQACSGKKDAQVNFSSADDQVKVSITGTRSNVFDPFRTTISVKAYNFKEGKLEFEIMADDLNSENVKYVWEDESHCVITFTERDKHVRTFRLLASPNQLQLAEVNE